MRDESIESGGEDAGLFSSIRLLNRKRLAGGFGARRRGLDIRFLIAIGAGKLQRSRHSRGFQRMHPMDLTVRPQLVNEMNPGYRDIIREFKALTGVGGILNTSFNLHGFPIVGTPKVALNTLASSGLDGLALGPFLVTKSGS